MMFVFSIVVCKYFWRVVFIGFFVRGVRKGVVGLGGYRILG